MWNLTWTAGTYTYLASSVDREGGIHRENKMRTEKAKTVFTELVNWESQKKLNWVPNPRTKF